MPGAAERQGEELHPLRLGARWSRRGSRASTTPAASAAPAKPRTRRRRWPFVVGVIAIFGFGIWWQCIRSREAQVVVTAHRWQRVIAIEEFNEREEEAWRNEVPLGVSRPICHDRQRSTRQVPDGEDCHTERRDKKDGTFEQVKKCTPKTRSEPVMDTWCRFTARRWKPVDEAKASGSGPSPTWPAGNLPPADPPAILGAKRQGKRTETLTLEFKDHGTCDVSRSRCRASTPTARSSRSRSARGRATWFVRRSNTPSASRARQPCPRSPAFGGGCCRDAAWRACGERIERTWAVETRWYERQRAAPGPWMKR